jgi:hypothetical protein
VMVMLTYNTEIMMRHKGQHNFILVQPAKSKTRCPVLDLYCWLGEVHGGLSLG